MQLTPERERRFQSFVDSGLYNSPVDVVDAALAAVEQRAVPDFEDCKRNWRRFFGMASIPVHRSKPMKPSGIASLCTMRFREAVIESVKQLQPHPRVGPLFPGSIPGLRFWPVKGFEMTT